MIESITLQFGTGVTSAFYFAQPFSDTTLTGIPIMFANSDRRKHPDNFVVCNGTTYRLVCMRLSTYTEADHDLPCHRTAVTVSMIIQWCTTSCSLDVAASLISSDALRQIVKRIRRPQRQPEPAALADFDVPARLRSILHGQPFMIKDTEACKCLLFG
uniref:Uncharacterized protein n=1 Tax=Trichuris muris TaxID=70415 RepID=A0A5S6Q7U9_TRIMR